MPFNLKQLDRFPNAPGVYLMQDSQGEILYVGKAKQLRVRLKNYFAPGRDGRPMVPYLVEKIETIETIVVSSEKEALLLENTLIKKHQPRYNALLKDDKSYVSLKLTKHEWPRLELARYKGEPPKDGIYFGPYMNSFVARQLLELASKLFPLRRCSDRELARGKPCFFYQIKKCPGPCAGACSKESYEKNVKRTIQFLRGQDKEILNSLYEEMEEAAASLDFEKAADLLKTIKQLENALETQQVFRITGVDSDVIALYRQAETVVVTQLFLQKGKLTGSQSYTFSGLIQEDDELLESFLLQHYKHREELPQEILLSTPIEDIEALEEILNDQKKRKVHILIPKKGDKLALVTMALTNAKAIFERSREEKVSKEKILLEMQEQLHLSRYPRHIECFDNSHLSGSSPVASMVVFLDGIKAPKAYRKYHIKTAEASDDYGALREILWRRYRKVQTPEELPDLILVDGGKGQLHVAEQVLEELNIPIPSLIAIAKEEGRHDKGSTLERFFIPQYQDPILLPRNSSVLFLMQQIRDEAHRFAIEFQRKKRSKESLLSQLDQVPGIGPIKSKRLLRHFGSIKRLKEASREALQEVKGITAADIEALLRLNT